MEVGRIAGATRVLGKSQGYIGLPVRDDREMVFIQEGETEPGVPCMVSAWFPSSEEMARMARGAPIYLRVLGTGHPPVSLVVGEVPEAL